MDNPSSKKIVKSILFALGYAMTVLLLLSFSTYLFWLFRDHQAYFWVFYINKLIYSFQLPIFLLFSLILYDRLLEKLAMGCGVYEKVAGYFVIGLLIMISILGSVADSGEIFHLHGMLPPWGQVVSATFATPS